MFKGKNSQEGSAGLTAMAAVVALSMASMYVTNSQHVSQNSMSAMKRAQSSEELNSVSLSDLSIYRSVMNSVKMKNGTEYAPAIIAANYFDPNWALTKNTKADLPSDFSFKNSKVVEFISLNDATPSLADAIKVVNGTGSAMGSTATNKITYLKSNFAPAPNNFYVKSIDVLATRTVNNQTSKVYAQIPLDPPAPKGMQLWLKEKSQGSFTQDFGTAAKPLTGGDYEFQIRGAGVVYYGVVEVNGKPFNVGLADGLVPHGANSPNASMTVIGTTEALGLGNQVVTTETAGTSYVTQDLEEKVTANSCGFLVQSGIVMKTGGTSVTVGNSSTATVPLRAYVVGVDGVADEKSEINVNMYVDPREEIVKVPLPVDMAGQDYTNSCSHTCSTYDQSIVDASMPDHDPVANRKYLADTRTGNVLTFDVNDRSTAQLQSQGLKGRLCQSWKKFSQYIWDNTTPHMTFAQAEQVGGSTWTNSNGTGLYDQAVHEKEFVVYAEPKCERKAVGSRSAASCGCFDANTQIQMADGTLMSVSDIREGDLVWNPKTGRAHRITEVIAGPELPAMYEVNTGTNTVLVTQFHPFLTKRGLITSAELKTGDILVDGQNESVVESINLKEADLSNPPVVWNIVLEGEGLDDHYVNANGIMTGDLYLQRLLASQKK